MQVVEIGLMRWVVSGRLGMELWGFIDDDSDCSSNPDAIVRISPLHWDFTFPNTQGSGRVRIGAGCTYNPLQMIEAMWQQIIESDNKNPTLVIDMDFDNFTFDPDKPFGELGADWE